MPFTLTMPKLSPTMEQGVITKWHKNEGEHVAAGDLLMEVSTDKATVEHNALDEGWLRKVLVAEGDEAAVNQAIAVFTEEEQESIEGYQPDGEPSIEAEPEEESTEEEVKPSTQPKVKKKVEGMSLPSFTPEPPLENYTFQFPSKQLTQKIQASPLAKKIAKERGLDLSTVKGSGPGGRIVERDLSQAQKSRAVGFGRKEDPKMPPGTYEEEPLSPVRKVISQRLQEAKSFIPHFYVTQTVNAQSLVTLREQLRKMGTAFSFNDFVIRASALALREHPQLNSGFNTETQSIIHFKTIDLSIAVDIPEGVITPIVRHADYKNVGEISAEVRALAKRAREGKLLPEEYKGGSFTISNLGMFGVTEFQAIINPPQAAILAVSGIQNVPVVVDGEVVPGKTMNISLSVDHRVVDGVAAAKFCNTIQKFLEHPASLLLA